MALRPEHLKLITRPGLCLAPGGGLAEIARTLTGSSIVLALHDQSHRGPSLSAQLRKQCGAPVVSVSVPGVIAAGSLQRRGVVALGSPADSRVAVRGFPKATRLSYSRAQALVATLARELGHQPRDLCGDRHGILCVADGADGGAELLAAAVAAAAPELAIVGGADPAAQIALDGRAFPEGAIVALLESPTPLHSFLVHPFRLTEQRTVVTRCDQQTIERLDGYPAAERFADLSGLDPALFRPEGNDRLRDAGVQLAWLLGGQMVLRPVLGTRAGALVVAGSVVPGAVLRVVRRRANPVASISSEIERALGALPHEVDAIWGAMCGSLLTSGCAKELAGLQPALHAFGCSWQHHAGTQTCCAVSGLVWSHRA